MPARPRGRRSVPSHGPPIAWALAGRAYLRGRLQPVEIGIDDDGWIRRVARRVDAPHRRDVGDAVILPSATDLHVHFRDPGPPDAPESFATGTLQAAYGGVGLVGDMPNTRPTVADSATLEAKAARVAGRAAVDVLLYAALSSARGAAGVAREAGAFKLFLAPTTAGPAPPGPGELPALLAAVPPTGLPLAVHAEDPAGCRPDADAHSVQGWDRVRPLASETSAVERLVVAAPPGLRLHVAHVTSADTAQRLASAGHSFEATPHHLLLDHRHEGDPRFKVNPPLRSDAVRAGLWERFRSGGIPCLASDHAPHSRNAKAVEFALAPSGMPGVETALPLLLERVRAAELPIEVLLAAACERPARWLGVPQGRIAPGHRANLLVVDFTRRTTLRARDLHAPCGWTAFEGHAAVFPRDHFLDGRPLVEGGEFVGARAGRVVRPEYADGPGAVRDPAAGIGGAERDRRAGREER